MSLHNVTSLTYAFRYGISYVMLKVTDILKRKLPKMVTNKLKRNVAKNEYKELEGKH